VAAKSVRNQNGIELRIAARSSTGEKGEAAYAELERRIGNLRGAVVPAWEFELRGPVPALWKVA
jgi:hypothetical protein